MNLRPLLNLPRFTISVVAASLCVAMSIAQSPIGGLTDKIDLQPKLGASVPMDAVVTTDDGKETTFGAIVKERPTMLLPIFYRCDGVCANEVSGLVKALVKEVSAVEKAAESGKTTDAVMPGKDFNIVLISIHPKETVELAHAHRAKVMDIFAMGWDKLSPAEREAKYAQVDPGWKFLTADPNEVKRICDSIGFKYTYDPKLNWVNHPSAAVFISPEGKVSSYITGTAYASKVLRASVARAAKNEVGPKGDLMLLGCIMIDPNTGKYTPVIKNIVNLAGVITVIIVGAAIALMIRSEKNAPNALGASQDNVAPGGNSE